LGVAKLHLVGRENVEVKVAVRVGAIGNFGTTPALRAGVMSRFEFSMNQAGRRKATGSSNELNEASMMVS
jgi:hypothetical protein